jgi:hypothetical protein
VIVIYNILLTVKLHITRNIQEKERVSLDFSRTRKALLKLGSLLPLYCYGSVEERVAWNLNIILSLSSSVEYKYSMVASSAKTRISSWCLKQDTEHGESFCIRPVKKACRMLRSYRLLIIASFLAYTFSVFRIFSLKDPISPSSWSHLNTDILTLPCTGTPQERRALASLGDAVSSQKWRDMTHCMINRERRLKGIFALHVSKSGGTSLCNAFKTEQCFVPPSDNKEANCWYSAMKTSTVDFAPKWVRSSSAHFFHLPRWLEADARQSTCLDIYNHLQQFQQKLAMSENWLPTNGPCQDHFMNVVIVRNPIHRLVSHYSHILRLCKRRTSNHTHLCDVLLQKDNQHFFNHTIMMEYFDIISDNYIVRSLNTMQGYKAPLGHMEESLSIALEHLNRFDWILLLLEGLEGSSNNSTNRLMDLGLGLSTVLRPARTKPSTQVVSLSKESENILMDLNKWDYEIWKEAQKLHELDLLSLHYMQQYASDLLLDFRKGSHRDSSCCGNVCVSQKNNSSLVKT